MIERISQIITKEEKEKKNSLPGEAYPFLLLPRRIINSFFKLLIFISWERIFSPNASLSFSIFSLYTLCYRTVDGINLREKKNEKPR